MLKLDSSTEADDVPAHNNTEVDVSEPTNKLLSAQPQQETVANIEKGSVLFLNYKLLIY